MSNYRDRLEGEVNRLGVTFISQKAGVARNTVYNWLAKGNVPLNYLVALGGLGADVIYVVTGQRSNAQAPAYSVGSDLPPDEQLLLDAYRGLTAPARKALLAELLTAGTKKKASRPKPTEETASVKIRGSGNRAAGRDYHEKE